MSDRLLGSGQYSRSEDDSRFADSFGSIQSIATSSAQNDSGLFEPNMRDERILPGEGYGTISAWRIELPKQFRAFDYDTIADVILHLRYTARDGGEVLKQQAVSELSAAVSKFLQADGKQGLVRIFSLRHEFPSEWHHFLNPTDTADKQTVELELAQDRFPLLFRGKKIGITGVDVFLKFKDLTDPTVFKADHADPTPLGDYKGRRFQVPSATGE